METNNHPEMGSGIPPALLAAMKRRPTLRSLLTEHPEILDMAEESSFLCDALCDSMSNLSRRLFDAKSQAFADPVAYVRCAVEQDSAVEKDERIDATDMRLARVRPLSVDDLLHSTDARSDRDLRSLEEALSQAERAAGAFQSADVYQSEGLSLLAEGAIEASEEAFATARAQTEREQRKEFLDDHAKALREDLASDRAYFACHAGTMLSRVAFNVLEMAIRDAQETVFDVAAFDENVAWFRSDDFLFWAHAACITEAAAYGMRVIRGLRALRADLTAAQEESDAGRAPGRARPLAQAQDRKPHPWQLPWMYSSTDRSVEDATYWLQVSRASRGRRTTDALFGRHKNGDRWIR